MNPSQREGAEMFHVATVTVLNWVKEGLLELDEHRCVTHESLQRFQKSYAGKSKLHARANKQLKDGHDNDEVDRVIQEALKTEPFDETLGDRYEAMLSESFKNREGVFYTPMSIVDDMMQELVADEDSLFLDPCCGTGNTVISCESFGKRGLAAASLWLRHRPQRCDDCPTTYQSLDGLRGSQYSLCRFFAGMPSSESEVRYGLHQPTLGKEAAAKAAVRLCQALSNGIQHRHLFLIPVFHPLCLEGRWSGRLAISRLFL